MSERNDNLKRYCYDCETTRQWLEHLSISHYNKQNLGFEIVEDVVLIPSGGIVRDFSGGVYTSTGEMLKQAFQRNGLETAEYLYASVDLSEISDIEDDKEIVYLGQYRNQWGSFLVDSISRLWFALKSPEKYHYIYLATQDDLGGIHDNAWKFLNAFGIQKDQIHYILHPVRVKKMIIPEMSYVPWGTVPINKGEQIPRFNSEYLETIYKVVDRISSPQIQTYEKVYFSRGKFSAKSKTDYGEQLITTLMERNGFYIVYPEEHSLEEQILYVNNCKVFASIGGSCAHNIIFSKTKPKMILFNRMNGYQWHQWMIDEMANVEPIIYVDMYCEPFKCFFNTTISGPYLYMINRNVQKFAEDNNFIIPHECMSICKKAKVIAGYTARVFHTILSSIKNRIIS